MSEPKEHPEPQLRQMLGYISQVRDALRMQNWDIILHRVAGDDDDDLARTWQNNNHATLNIELGPDFFEQTPERIRNAMVHELIHAQHRDVSGLWEACTIHNDDIAPAEARAWDGDFHMFMERFVSWATAFIAPNVPDYDPEATYVTETGCYLIGEHTA